MNQYPGFVPMMVPQPYMVAMPTAIPMSGAVGPGLPALPQVLHPQVAAAHVAGAPVVTSSVVNAPGMNAVRAAQLSQGVGQFQQGMGQLAAQGMGQHLGVPGVAGMPGMPPSHQGPMSIPTAKVIPQIPSGSPDSRKRPFNDQDKGKGGRFGNRWQSNPEQDVEEPNADDSLCVLDHFNSDLNLNIDSDGYGACVMLDPPGFCFTWAGSRATYGVCKGKVFYEVHILEHLPADFGEDHQELDPHVVRVGWSIDSSSFQLGEEPWSFGYGGTGKFSTNCRFSDYGQRFGAGDVIGALLDLDSRPASISFTKNGTWLGVAIPLHGFPVGSKDMALYPHVLSKNCRIKVNFGQADPWFPPPPGFAYIGQLPLPERVRGMRCPERKADCEMIMIVGLPGVGKTTWGINMQKSHPEKRYNIIGTDTLIDKMRVMGLPRKRNYHGRWDVLIDKATKCLNKLFQIASRRKRNYILDQTNVYASARRRKMKFFNGFFRIGAVIQPDDPEMQRRSHKRTVEDGKVVPESAVLEMKANFSLPEDRDNIFDRIDFIELPKEKVQPLLEQYVREGHEKRPPREEVFRHDNRFQKQDQNTGYNQQGSRPPQNQSPFSQPGLQRSMMGGPSKSPMGPVQVKMEPQWFGEGAGLLGRAPDMENPNTKRIKLEQEAMGGGRQQGGALDLLKQQYEEAEQQENSQWGQPPGHPPPSSQEFVTIKEEPRWHPHAQDQAAAILGGGIGIQGAPLPPHLAQQAGTLVVSPPPGSIPMAGALGAQPPPPPPPIMPGQLAHAATGHAFVALAPLPPPGPPPAMLAMGGAGALGAAPPGFPHHLQQFEAGSQQSLQPGGIFGQSSWQQSESSTSTTNTTSRFSQSGSDASSSQRDWGQQAGDSMQQGQGGWQGLGGQQQQQQPWQNQDKSRDSQKGWQGSDNSSGNNWQQNQGPGNSSRSFDQGRGKFGDSPRDSSRPSGYDSQSQSYGGKSMGGSDSSGRRFDDFSRPPPDMRGGGRSDDLHGGDGRRDRGYGSGGQSYGDGGNDRWNSSSQRSSSNDRWSSSSGSRQDRPGQQESGDNRWSGGGRQDGRGQNDRWSGGGRSDGRGQNDRWGQRGQEGPSSQDRERDRDRGRERDRGGRDRDRDQDRDSYGRDKERDRGSRDRDQDSGEPRQRRRKSKWDNPEEDGGNKPDSSSDFQQQTFKQEPPSTGYGGPSFQSDQQQYYNRPGQYQSPEPEESGSQSPFPQKGMNFNKPPPSSSASGPEGPPPGMAGQGGFPKDRPTELPSLMDVCFGNRPPPPTADGDQGNDNPKSSGGETSLLGPVPSGPPPKLGGKMGGSSQQSDTIPNTAVPPPRDGPPPSFGGSGGGGPGMNRPPFQPGGAPRFPGSNAPDAGGMGGGQRPNFRMEGPPRPMRPRNPQNFSGPPGNMGPMGGPPNVPWNQNRFGGGGGRGGMPPRPRFDGPGGPPGGGRFPGGPSPMRWPRGPR